MFGVFPVFKKHSKLDYSNYCPISLLSNIEKILDKKCIKDYIPFSITITLIYKLQFGFRQIRLIFNQQIPVPAPYSNIDPS